jgi:hypothetical protein
VNLAAWATCTRLCGWTCTRTQNTDNVITGETDPNAPAADQITISVGDDDHAVIVFSTGWGDGIYSTRIGRTTDGDVACFLTDFKALPTKDDGPSRLSSPTAALLRLAAPAGRYAVQEPHRHDLAVTETIEDVLLALPVCMTNPVCVRWWGGCRGLRSRFR